MTKLSPEAKSLVAKVGELWDAHRTGRITNQAAIRARIEAEYAEVERRSAFALSEAIRRAMEGGATATALREVTTKDPRTFKRFREFDGLGTLP